MLNHLPDLSGKWFIKGLLHAQFGDASNVANSGLGAL